VIDYLVWFEQTALWCIIVIVVYINMTLDEDHIDFDSAGFQSNNNIDRKSSDVFVIEVLI
jgi:hypothetical protein